MHTSPLSPGGPRIGIPVRLSSSLDPDPRVREATGLFEYIVSLVRDGGGEPVLLTAETGDAGLAETLKGLAGVVLPGGGDLDPRLYGEEQRAECYDVNPAQDALDLAVARITIDESLPLFGICRGHQLLNVLYGGTLIQDMPAGEVIHHEPASAGTDPDSSGPWAWHDVDVVPGSKVAGLYSPDSKPEGLTVKIASGHHQAVARVAEGLVVTARAADGTVEALEDPQRWVASVQWHPEARELPAEERVVPFRAFVEVCRSKK
ncbi:gamma-glutamyl-gamma-aminobutyrate hydrolase family protein [Arthrobacter sp. ISL-72]|uniref:gamma-glutamyl-gamma-aminobutyrate hydrolase family protein n=1 Tax=Arthrobacter sp. ISL-72 TaxID=2819114 RepID=UPI001BE5CF83|nr:type 1 glutamine amidotransferase [Arthrobacter sp. ISL-72]MBT2596076.1 type 1 glutamine amidotransferase [Arthrobacter sp. ISL-72]